MALALSTQIERKQKRIDELNKQIGELKKRKEDSSKSNPARYALGNDVITAGISLERGDVVGHHALQEYLKKWRPRIEKAIEDYRLTHSPEDFKRPKKASSSEDVIAETEAPIEPVITENNGFESVF